MPKLQRRKFARKLLAIGSTSLAAATVTLADEHTGSKKPFNQREYPSVSDWGAICDGVTDDTDSIQNAIDELISRGKPFALFFPGHCKISRALLFNRKLDCSEMPSGITLFGPPTHTGFDTGDDAPASITATGRMQAVLDLRACHHIAVVNLGFAGPPMSIGQFILLGSDGCKNPMVIGAIGKISDCKFYGAETAIKADLTSGLQINNCNISRCSNNGISLNSSGDFNIASNYINNVGRPGHHIPQDRYYGGAAILIYGGGGDGNIFGGKIEVNSKGIVIDNAQSINISTIIFDKNLEFSIAISGNVATHKEQTNLGHQPRSISISSCHFVSSGVVGPKKCHIYVGNFGADLEASIAVSGCSFAFGGTKGVDIDTTVDKLVPRIGPATIYLLENHGTGDSRINVSSSANQYSEGSTRTTIDAVSKAIHVRSASDNFDLAKLPNLMHPDSIFASVSTLLFGSINSTLTSLQPGESSNFPTLFIDGARPGDFVQCSPPGNMGVLSLQSFVSKDNQVTCTITNFDKQARSVPTGAYRVRIIK
jgi:hypothetical protein